MNSKTVYIHTLGCQMNVYDSERIAAGMSEMGYHRVSSAEAADMVIINTCAIRAKAEQKLYSLVGRLADLKKKKPALRIGIGGCVAQQEGKNLLKRQSCIDFVFGTHAIGRLNDLIAHAEISGKRFVDIEMAECPDDDFSYALNATISRQISRFVTIMTGCDNYCTYCVVPYVRGAEISRPPEHILKEVQLLADAGVREITLLGQNVNSYGQKEGWHDFSELLNQISRIDNIVRIRFTTSHPKDLSERLIQSFRELNKVSHHIHLPVQSGSDRILKRMNRRYTHADYLAKIDRLREVCPDMAVTSDFIVGFPGEDETDFQDTLNLMRTVQFDSVFAFKYSDRPSAPASRFSNKVHEDIKSDRLGRLLELQKNSTFYRHQSLIGTRQEILVEGPSPRTSESDQSIVQWTGRTSGNHIVHFSPLNRDGATQPDLTGQMVTLHISRSFSHSLWGDGIPEQTT
ncbi:MAG: tRNA (N6-isopentenyl adenosine(37)-C2)-methylthiotransferase MiaB [Desulfatirhabdiaceae bacterium]